MILAAAVLLAGSCVNTIRYEFDLADGRIVMNARMSTADDRHYVYLSWSYPDRTEALHGAEVTCTVNGAKMCSVREEVVVSDGTEYGGAATFAYPLDVAFAPGDVVRITATVGTQTAWAEVTVPEAADVTGVKAGRAMHGFMGERQELVDITTTIRDGAGDSYYALGLRAGIQAVFHSYDAAGHAYPDLTYGTEEPMSFTVFNDPVLDDGYTSLASIEENILNGLLPMNSTCCFSDRLFRGAETDVTVVVDPDWADLPWVDMTDVPESVVSADVTCTAIVQVYATDYDTYLYYRALNNLETYGYEGSFIVEPTTLPSNVHGGMGLVGILTETRASTSLGTVHRDRTDWPIYTGYGS